MDNNNPMPEQPAVNQAAAMPQTPMPEAPQMSNVPLGTPPSSGKNMMMIIVLAFVVVAVLVAAGIYMYMRVSKNNPDLSKTSNATQQGAPDPALTSADTDIQNLVVPDVSADFSDVDNDLKTL